MGGNNTKLAQTFGKKRRTRHKKNVNTFTVHVNAAQTATAVLGFEAVFQLTCELVEKCGPKEILENGRKYFNQSVHDYWVPALVGTLLTSVVAIGHAKWTTGKWGGKVTAQQMKDIFTYACSVYGPLLFMKILDKAAQFVASGFEKDAKFEPESIDHVLTTLAFVLFGSTILVDAVSKAFYVPRIMEYFECGPDSITDLEASWASLTNASLPFGAGLTGATLVMEYLQKLGHYAGSTGTPVVNTLITSVAAGASVYATKGLAWVGGKVKDKVVGCGSWVHLNCWNTDLKESQQQIQNLINTDVDDLEKSYNSYSSISK